MIALKLILQKLSIQLICTDYFASSIHGFDFEWKSFIIKNVNLVSNVLEQVTPYLLAYNTRMCASEFQSAFFLCLSFILFLPTAHRHAYLIHLREIARVSPNFHPRSVHGWWSSPLLGSGVLEEFNVLLTTNEFYAIFHIYKLCKKCNNVLISPILEIVA